MSGFTSALGPLAVAAAAAAVALGYFASEDDQANKDAANAAIGAENLGSKAAVEIRSGNLDAAKSTVEAQIAATKEALAKTQAAGEGGMLQNLFQGIARLTGGDNEAAVQGQVVAQVKQENALKSSLAKQEELLSGIRDAIKSGGMGPNRGDTPSKSSISGG
jgi:hypothetical protein